MRKEKIRLEYMLKAGSGNIVWSIISILHPAWKHGLQTR